MIQELNIHSTAIQPRQPGMYLVLLHNRNDNIWQWEISYYDQNIGWSAGSDVVNAWAELPNALFVSMGLQTERLKDTMESPQRFMQKMFKIALMQKKEG